MSEVKESLLSDLARNVVEMEDDEVVVTANTFIEKNFDAYEGIANGLAIGMDKAGKLYEEEEYYIPELLMCSDAMYAGLDVLKDRKSVV